MEHPVMLSYGIPCQAVQWNILSNNHTLYILFGSGTEEHEPQLGHHPEAGQ